ncbi:hypothetical protein HDE_14340 [Halotydeus destructor]|nr:hypothetical protein HDE_14340 [Halotydeus destructor]
MSYSPVSHIWRAENVSFEQKVKRTTMMKRLLTLFAIQHSLLTLCQALNCDGTKLVEYGGPDSIFYLMPDRFPAGGKNPILAVTKGKDANAVWLKRDYQITAWPFSQASGSSSQGMFTDRKRTHTGGSPHPNKQFVTYRTDGYSTCLELADLNKTSNCTDASHRFQGLTDYSRGKIIDRISGTQLSSERYLFSLHTITHGSIEYHQVLLQENGSLSHSRTSSAPLPTALVSVMNYDRNIEKIVAFHGNITGYYDYDESRNNLLTINRKIDYQSSSPWLGCIFEICFDGRIDSITRTDNADSYRIYRGRFNRRIHGPSYRGWSPNGNSWHQAIDRLPDISNSSTAYLSSFITVCSVQASTSKPKRFVCSYKFPNLTVITSAGNLDAIFVLNETRLIYIISDDHYITYRADSLNRLNFTYIEHGRLSDLWNGLPSEIDGATRSLDNTQIIFTRENFIFYANLTSMKQNGSAQEPKLIQEDLDQEKCDDQFYATSKEAALLNISNFQEFKTYKLQFLPPVITTTSRTPTAPDLPKIFLWIVTIGTIFALVVSLIIFKCKSKKSTNRSNEAFYPAGLSTSATEQTSVLLMESKTQTRTPASEDLKKDTLPFANEIK